MRKWRTSNPGRAAYSSVRDHAEARKIKFTLTYEQFLTVIKGTGYLEHSGSRRSDLQIDRVEAHKDYSFDNVHVVTCGENSKKSNWERHLPEHKRDMIRRRQQEIEDDQPF